MSDLHVYCIDVRLAPAGEGLGLVLRLVETEGVRVDALLLRHEVVLDPFAVCVPAEEEEQILERLAALDGAATQDGALLLGDGAVVVPAFQATVATDLTVGCGVAGDAAGCMDVVTAGVIPLRVRFTADAFVTDADGPRLETAVLDQERAVHVPLSLWHAARPVREVAVDVADEPVIDLDGVPALT